MYEIDQEVIDELTAEIWYYEGREPSPDEVKAIAERQQAILALWQATQG